MKKTSKITSTIYILIVLTFLYIPIISIIVFSFNSIGNNMVFESLSFRWYIQLFTEDRYLRIIGTTLLISVISTISSTIIGVLASLSISKQRKIFRDIVLNVNSIPIMSPEIITAIALFIFFGAFSIPRGYTTLILAHIAFSTPYVIINVYPKVMRLDPNLIDAAYDLGATPVKVLFKVILPQLKGAILAGMAIAFAMSFDDFVISLFTSGGIVQNISIYLWTFRGRTVPLTMNALSTIILICIGFKVVFDYTRSNKLTKKEGD